MTQKHILAVALCIVSSNIAAKPPGTLIVGGEEAAKHQFPHLVSVSVFLTDWSFHFCGGSLIALDLVLTSASCVDNDVDFIIVTAGDHYLFEDDGTEQKLLNQQVIIHENFNSSHRFDNDIALIKLTEKFEKTKAVQPIALPTAALNPDNSEYGMAVGWGATNFEEDFTDRVHTANLTIFERAQCNALPFFELADGSFCTLDTKGGLKDDYGGPLMCSEMPGVICGVMSISIPEVGSQNGILGVYVNVSSYLDWIEANTPVDPTTTTTSTETSSAGTSPTITSPTSTSSIRPNSTTRIPSTTSPITTIPTESTPGGSSRLAVGVLSTIFAILLVFY